MKNLVTALWKLIRGSNLLILTLLFLLIRYTITLPVLGFEGTGSGLSTFRFQMILLATILIAAGGNIINDILDQQPDAINKPGNNIIGTKLSESSARILYVTVTALGLLSGWIGSKDLPGASYYLLFPLSAGLLFFYSYSYKNIPFLGNLVIASLSAVAVMTGILFDREAMQPGPVFTLVCGYALFAFLMTLIREIVKDCQDLEGDRQFGARTLAVWAGPDFSRKLASFLTMVTLGCLAWVQVYSQQWENKIAFSYVTLLIDIPLAILSVRIWLSESSATDGKNAFLAKLIMVSGIGSMAVFYATF